MFSPLVQRLSLCLLALGLLGCGAVQRPDGGQGPLLRGSKVPPLSAHDHKGVRVSLRALEGGYVLVYFYPKDGTPGCTKEACAFRDVWDKYEQAGVRVIGVSADDAASHRQFAEEYDLPFSLIPDPDYLWADAFGVARFLGMTSRMSFLIDPKGHVVKAYPDVDAGLHAQAVLEDHARMVRAGGGPPPPPPEDEVLDPAPAEASPGESSLDGSTTLQPSEPPSATP